jgi:dihydrofolate reductase
MKVILYIASTLNGLAAKSDGDSDWVSAENTTDFNSFCRQIGCVIMGRHTFDIFNEMEFKDWPAATGLHIILTQQTYLATKHPDVLFSPSPRSCLQTAKTRGFDHVVVIGGSQTFGIFMQENLVDEIYLDIEPLVFGKGMPLFDAGDFESKLKFIEFKQLSPQTVQLHYLINK